MKASRWYLLGDLEPETLFWLDGIEGLPLYSCGQFGSSRHMYYFKFLQAALEFPSSTEPIGYVLGIKVVRLGCRWRLGNTGHLQSLKQDA